MAMLWIRRGRDDDAARHFLDIAPGIMQKLFRQASENAF
jgi:hypothetical protein